MRCAPPREVLCCSGTSALVVYLAFRSHAFRLPSRRVPKFNYLLSRTLLPPPLCDHQHRGPGKVCRTPPNRTPHNRAALDWGGGGCRSGLTNHRQGRPSSLVSTPWMSPSPRDTRQVGIMITVVLPCRDVAPPPSSPPRVETPGPDQSFGPRYGSHWQGIHQRRRRTRG